MAPTNERRIPRRSQQRPSQRLSKMKLLTSSSSLSSEISSDGSDILEENLDSHPFFSEHGLMITAQDGHIRFHLCLDDNYPEIHPNVYAPAALTDMRKLTGGGSGVAVFGGRHPELGDLVMKHGGRKDLNELFALATIAHELRLRGSENHCLEVVEDMQRRLPEFRMIYISPSHIMERRLKLWDKLKTLTESFSTNRLPSQRRSSIHVDTAALDLINSENMSIRLYECLHDFFSIQVDTESKHPSLAVIFPKGSCESLNARTVVLHNDSYEDLKATVEELIPIMEDRLLKFTLAQKTIGGESPRTGNQWLYSGQLSGDILENLICEFVRVIKHLQEVTRPHEVDVLKEVRSELERFENDETAEASSLSDTANTFVGNAIKKNFHEKKGRITFLNRMGEQFRGESLILTEEEVFPAKCIGALLRRESIMSDIFLDAPSEPAPVAPGSDYWKNILRRAVDDRESMSPSALKRVWDCGLADAGIHNLFVTETDLFLFDLGEPQLQSLPGFLTKFLFSFFHTLGMEDDDTTGWVRRFDVEGDKLKLTEATKDLLPKAYEAFEKSLDRLILEVLDGDQKLRWLLLQYVTLQLLSDTAFCLQRWAIKGGGEDREHNHQKGIEMWLWRALWDIYIACDINTLESWARFRIEAPHLSARSPLLEGTASISKIRETVNILKSSLKEIDGLPF
eukprot:scaffold3653_cov124-Cylindrotheca_fusiformis.AAC.3